MDTQTKLRQIIREEIRTELQMFKREIVEELRRNNSPTLTERKDVPTERVKKKPTSFQQEYRKPKPSHSRYSNDSALNRILEDTSPFEEDAEIYYEPSRVKKTNEFDFLMETHSHKTTQPVPIKPKMPSEPITGPTGEVIDTSKQEVRKVLNVLNMDFSSKLKAMEQAAKNNRP
jgi:hypothetical protein